MALPQIEYRGFSRHSSGTVTYYLQKESCVFTGLTSSAYAMSTINAAEEILLAIRKAHRLFHPIHFYDLQTHLGYPILRPGEYVYDEILCKPYAVNSVAHSDSGYLSWQPRHCPDAIELIFCQYLGPLPHQINDPDRVHLIK